ncbi:hypothetical protein ACHQM5_019920 [Ranunculus cassubicifolius]
MNGTYYEPPHPFQQPPSKYHKRFCFLKITSSLILGAGVIALVIWYASRPLKIQVHVVSAELTEFNLTRGNILNYNLSLNLAVRNPNKKVTVYYDMLNGTAFYEKERFGRDTRSPFYQGRKNTTNVRADFHGQQVMVFDDSKIKKYEQEMSDGVFRIHVKFNTRTRFKMGGLKTMYMKPEVDCHLKVPLAANGRFEVTKCNVDS